MYNFCDKIKLPNTYKLPPTVPVVTNKLPSIEAPPKIRTAPFDRLVASTGLLKYVIVLSEKVAFGPLKFELFATVN